MNLRHEWKIEINAADQVSLRARLSAIMRPDPHAENGVYRIRSLYFDDLYDTALRQKLDGVNMREKYRIRCYNDDVSLIHLEKKCKIGDLTGKRQAILTRDETQAIIDGNIDLLSASDNDLILQLYSKMRSSTLRPRTIVEYTREPYIFDAGNVRVTIDSNLRTGLSPGDFLNPDAVTVPSGDAPMILEVKWDAFLPEIIRDCVQVRGRQAGAFSKYAQCRIYG